MAKTKFDASKYPDIVRPEKWEDCGRKDLSIIPIAERMGWKLEFDDRDKSLGRTTIDNVPHFPVGFKKDNVHVWKAGKTLSEGFELFWVCADLIDGSYKNHRQYKYDNLLDCLRDELQNIDS